MALWHTGLDLDVQAAEGVRFVTGAHVGANVDVAEVRASTDAVILAAGATRPRDLPIAGRDADGIHFAMDFLTANTKSLLDSGLTDGNFISAKVLVSAVDIKLRHVSALYMVECCSAFEGRATRHASDL